MNRYEAMVILPERLTEEEIEKGLDTFCKVIKALGGSANRPTRLGRRPFARPLKKETSGEFALVNFSIDNQKLVELREQIRHDEYIFRVSISRVDEKAVKRNLDKAAAAAAAAPDA